MTRAGLVLGPLVLLASIATAFASDGITATQVAVDPSAGFSLEHIVRAFGPHGVIVWAAITLSRGIQLNVVHRLSDDDRLLLRRALRTRPELKELKDDDEDDAEAA